MRTSSGSGPYRVGGLGSLSSSSNLSPLAAPFRVDKSLQKQNSTNASVTYTDVPMYGPSFDPAGQFWNHSSSATGSKFETESMGINPTCSSSPAIYGYTGSQPSGTAAGVYHVSSGLASTFDPFSYGPFSDPTSTASIESVEPYYSPYVSHPPQKDGYLGLGVTSGQTIGLSNSSAAHLGGCGSSVSDHLQHRSGYRDSNRGSFWSGVNEQGKWSDHAQGFGSKESNQSDLQSSNFPFVVGGLNRSQPSVFPTHPFSNGISDNKTPDGSNKSNLKKDGCFDIFGGTYCLGSLGIDKQDSRSFLDRSRLPTPVSSSIPNESSHLQDTIVQPVTNFFGSQKANGTSLGGHFSQNDLYVFGCPSTTIAFPMSENKSPYGENSSSAVGAFSAPKPNVQVNTDAIGSNLSAGHDYSYTTESQIPLGAIRQSRIVIRRPPSSSVMSSSSSTQTGEPLRSTIGGETSSSAFGAFSAPKPNVKVSADAIGSNLSAGHDYSYTTEPQIPLGAIRQSRIVIRRPPSSSAMTSSSSTQTGEPLRSTIGSKDTSEKGQVSPKLPHQFISDGVDVNVNDVQAAYSGGSDVHNPAEDSPCWRGASLNRLSPFAVSEGIAPDVLDKKLDEWKSLNSRVSQVKSCLVDTSDRQDLFPEKVKERNLAERPSVPECVLKDDEERCFSIRQPFCFDLNAGDGFQSAGESFVSTKECCIQNNSDTELLLGSMPVEKAAKLICGEMKVPSSIQMSEATAFEGSRKLPLIMANNSFDVPSSSENNHLSLPPGNTASLKHCQATSKVSNTNIDVNMLLKDMKNLSEIFRSYCFNKRASVAEEQSIAIKCIIANLNASIDVMAGETSSTIPDAQMVNNLAIEALAATVKLGGTSESLFDFVSCKDDANAKRGDNILKLQALKKILHANFPVEEEIDQQKLLYKNLWLDAEASLCAMTAKARYLRVKAEMEGALDGAEGREIPSSSNNCGDVDRTIKLINCGIDSSVPIGCQKSCGTSENSHADSKVNKCHIPNTQVVTITSEKSEGQNHFSTLHASKQANATNDSDGSGSTIHDNDAKASVMARYQILKTQIETSDAPTREYITSNAIEAENPVLARYQILKTWVETSEVPTQECTTNDAMEADSPVLANYQILRCRVNHDSLNNECKSPPGEDNYMPDRESLSPIYQILDSGVDNSDSLFKGGDSQNSLLLSNSVGVSDVGESSVIARFRIIQNRANHSDIVDVDQILVSPVKILGDGNGEGGLSGLQQKNVFKRAFGPYPEFTEDEDEDVNQFGISRHNEAYLNQYCKSNRINGQIFESWYGNDGSASDWGHVSKKDLHRPN